MGITLALLQSGWAIATMFRYFGSKASTADFVADIALNGGRALSAADAFGGLGTMGAVFKRRGCFVTTCDILTFPNAFQHARVACQRRPSFLRVRAELGISTTDALCDFLNSANQPSGWF